MLLYYRIIQLCVYVALFAIGYIVYVYGCRLLERFSQWLLRKHYHKDWGIIPTAIILFGYIFLFYYIGSEIKVVYVEKNSQTYHLTKKCNAIHQRKTSLAFRFQVVANGYYLCDDCEIDEYIKYDE